MDNSSSPAAFVAMIDRAGQRLETSFGNGRMVWRCWGQGPDLVLFHGGGGSWNHWLRNVLPLSRRYRVWAPDLPGFGESDTPADPADRASLAESVIAGLAALSLPGRFALVGFSFGSWVASMVADRRPGWISRLILIGNGMTEWRPQLNLHSVRDMTDSRQIAGTHRHNLRQLMLHNPDAIDALALQLQTENVRQSRIRREHMAAKDPLRALIPLLRVPLGGIWGAHDAICRPAADKIALRQMQPGARTAIIAEAGHWVSYEAPDAFNAALEDLLGEESP